MHGEVQQHPQKGLPPGPVQVQALALLAAAEYALGLSDVSMEMLNLSSISGYINNFQHFYQESTWHGIFH